MHRLPTRLQLSRERRRRLLRVAAGDEPADLALVGGASPATLGCLAAVGVTSDHEAITGDELAARIELGLWTMIRHSTLRRDGTGLARAVHERALPIDRLMLTGDGMLPQDLARGHMDRVVRAVVEGGVPPIDAVRMATLSPATYLGLDAHLGSLAPGRCADLLVVDAYRRVVRLGGGVASAGAEVALPVFGHLRDGGVDALAADLEAFEHDAGVPERWPPLTYLAIFLSLPALPGVALTPDGVIDVRSGGRLATSQELVYA